MLPVMNLKYIFFAVVCAFSSVSLSAQNLFSSAQVLYDHDSPYYDDIYFAAMESGSTLLSYRKPVSVPELYLTYKYIDEDILSEPGAAGYNELSAFFHKNNALFTHENFSFDINLRLALQVHYVQNRGKEKEPRLDPYLRYNQMPEALAVPISLYLSPYVYGYSVLAVGKNFSGYGLSYPYTNVPLEQKALDYHFPKKAGIAAGNSFFNIHVGRGRLNLGKTLNGSMVMADTADRLDFIDASLFFKHAKVDLTVAELQPQRFFISHEVSVRPVKQFAITIHEGLILDSVFDPKFLNPFMIFHNYAAWKEPYVKHGEKDDRVIGCQLGLDINIVPVKNVRLYGQFGMNQFQTPSELKGGSSHVPNSMGGLAGIEYIYPIKYGFLVFTAEGMYADPWLYIGYKKHTSFYAHRKENVYASETYDKSEINYWLANPYGPDTITAFLKTALVLPHKYHADFTYRFVAKGENEDKFFGTEGDEYYPTKQTPEMAKYKTPSGKAAFFHTLKISAGYTILKGLDINGSFSWTAANGRVSGHSVAFQTSVIYSIR